MGGMAMMAAARARMAAHLENQTKMDLPVPSGGDTRVSTLCSIMGNSALEFGEQSKKANLGGGKKRSVSFDNGGSMMAQVCQEKEERK
jgi:hypothetical protein